MAELARKEGQRIKSALQQASSKEEQQTIVQQAYQQVSEVTKSNPQFGMLLGEAVKSAIQEAQEDPKCQNKPETEEDTDPAASQSPTGQPQGRISPNQTGQPQSRVSQVPSPIAASPEQSALMDQQDEILGQFYPEEWVSMLDCKG